MMQASQSNGIHLSAIHSAQHEYETSQGDTEVDGNMEGGQVLLFVNEWLTTIADAIVGLFLGQIVQIKSLTALGSAQLLVDIDYLR